MLKIENLNKEYKTDAETIHALKGVSFNINKGEIVALTGPSGSGKTSMLNIIGCLDKATSGKVVINGRDISNISKKEMTLIRRNNLGFVFQDNHLIPALTAIENVMLPTLFSRKIDKKNALTLLNKVGLIDRINHLPKQLSGGQNQRVAIARALVNNPSLILADEPTGRLDVEMKLEIFNLFKKLANDGISILLATHDIEIANMCDRNLRLKGGIIDAN